MCLSSNEVKVYNSLVNSLINWKWCTTDECMNHSACCAVDYMKCSDIFAVKYCQQLVCLAAAGEISSVWARSSEKSGKGQRRERWIRTTETGEACEEERRREEDDSRWWAKNTWIDWRRGWRDAERNQWTGTVNWQTDPQGYATTEGRSYFYHWMDLNFWNAVDILRVSYHNDVTFFTLNN